MQPISVRLPAAVVDMVQVIRNKAENATYRENVAGRLEFLASFCSEEAKRYRAEQNQAAEGRRRRKKA